MPKIMDSERSLNPDGKICLSLFHVSAIHSMMASARGRRRGPLTVTALRRSNPSAKPTQN